MAGTDGLRTPGEFDRVAIEALVEAGHTAEEAASVVATLRAAGVMRSSIEVTPAGIRLAGTRADITLTNGWQVSGQVTRDGQPLVPPREPWMDLMHNGLPEGAPPPGFCADCGCSPQQHPNSTCDEMRSVQGSSESQR